jgi:hypothetical protein
LFVIGSFSWSILKCGCPDWVLLHDNALAHQLLLMQLQLTKHNTVVVFHPSYSPASHCDFCLCHGWKTFFFFFQGCSRGPSGFKDCVVCGGFQKRFEQLYTCWQKFIAAEGQYVKGASVLRTSHCCQI